MSKANAPQVAKLLREYAQRTALRGGNPYYRAKAYSRAADSLAALAEPSTAWSRRSGSPKSPASARPSLISSPSCTGPAPPQSRETPQGTPRRRAYFPVLLF